MASPVDFISGERYASIPDNFENENTGTFTNHIPFVCTSPSCVLTIPCSLKEMPRLTLVAISGSGNPVAFERNGTVLEDLGFTSMI